MVLLAWSGPRGGVSLAALAIPLLLANGQPFPERDLLVFLTFSVILVTLVGAALTLPVVVAWLRPDGDDVSQMEERKARGAMAAAALERVDVLEGRGQLEPHIAALLRRRYQRRQAHGMRHDDDAGGRHEDEIAQRLVGAEQELLDVQRSSLIKLRDMGEIDNVVLRHLQLMLDMAAASIPGASTSSCSTIGSGLRLASKATEKVCPPGTFEAALTSSLLRQRSASGADRRLRA